MRARRKRKIPLPSAPVFVLMVAVMLGSLKLRHFRCFEQFETEFAQGTNFIVGPNAHGKTSLLEAACILLRLQSPRITQLARVVQHGRRGFVTDGFHGARHLQFYFSPERKKLALDQREAAEIFGGGVNAFSRYENGKTKPSLALVKLLRVLDRHPDLLDEVRAA